MLTIIDAYTLYKINMIVREFPKSVILAISNEVIVDHSWLLTI